MNYYFVFFELGGGVCSIALTTSSNLSGCRLIFSSLVWAVFAFVLSSRSWIKAARSSLTSLFSQTHCL